MSLRLLFKTCIKYFTGRDLNLDKNIPFIYLIRVLFIKLKCIVRGILYHQKIIFVGKGTTILSKSKCLFSKGVQIGNYCNIDGMSKDGLIIGKGSKISDFSIIKVSGTLKDLGEKVEIGENVGIGEFAHIGGAGGVYIGDNTIAGSYLSIHPEDHIFDDKEKLIRLQGYTRETITIGKNCWIGAKVTFLNGSKIGDNCVVGAGSVVRGSFPSSVVIAGVPAKIIKKI